MQQWLQKFFGSAMSLLEPICVADADREMLRRWVGQIGVSVERLAFMMDAMSHMAPVLAETLLCHNVGVSCEVIKF